MIENVVFQVCVCVFSEFTFGGGFSALWQGSTAPDHSLKLIPNTLQKRDHDK